MLSMNPKRGFVSLFIFQYFWFADSFDVLEFTSHSEIAIEGNNLYQSVSSAVECGLICANSIGCCEASFNAVSNVCSASYGMDEFRISENDAVLLEIKQTVHVQEDGWEELGNSCYFFSEELKIWNDAMSDCKSRGGYLAEVTSNIEKDILKSRVQLLSDHFWIGATDFQKKGEWVWQTSKTLVTVADWAYGQPDNRGNSQYCLRISHPKDSFWQGWDDSFCFEEDRFICERATC